MVTSNIHKIEVSTIYYLPEVSRRATVIKIKTVRKPIYRNVKIRRMILPLNKYSRAYIYAKKPFR